MRVCFISSFHMREEDKEMVLQENEIQYPLMQGKTRSFVAK